MTAVTTKKTTPRLSAQAAASLDPEARDRAVAALHKHARFAGASVATITRWAYQIETAPEAVLRHMVAEAMKDPAPNLAVWAVANDVLPDLAPEILPEARRRREKRLSDRELRRAQLEAEDAKRKDVKAIRTEALEEHMELLLLLWNKGALGNYMADYLSKKIEREKAAEPAEPADHGDNVVSVPFGSRPAH